MDIVRDILDRVFGATDRPLEDIEREIRSDYGGERVYVPRDGDHAHTEISLRNAAIRADWQRGERIELIVRRYKVSRRRVYQLVKVLP